MRRLPAFATGRIGYVLHAFKIMGVSDGFLQRDPSSAGPVRRLQVPSFVSRQVLSARATDETNAQSRCSRAIAIYSYPICLQSNHLSDDPGLASAREPAVAGADIGSMVREDSLAVAWFGFCLSAGLASVSRDSPVLCEARVAAGQVPVVH